MRSSLKLGSRIRPEAHAEGGNTQNPRKERKPRRREAEKANKWGSSGDSGRMRSGADESVVTSLPPVQSGPSGPSVQQAHDEPGHLVASAAPQTVARRTKTTVTRALEAKPTFSSIAAIYFFNGRGDVLIQRLYRDGIDHPSVPLLYRTHVLNAPSSTSGFGGYGSNGRDTGRKPIVMLPNGDAMLTYRPRNSNVAVVAITSSNSNCMMILQFLIGLVSLVQSYCDGQFHEDVVKGNFVLILELLDDTLDHGYPQLTDPALAKAFIYQKPKASFLDKLGGTSSEKEKRKKELQAQSSTMQVTGAVGWRKDGSVKYKKNEVYLDVIESVSVLMSANGDVLSSDVNGRISMRSCLSGMPEVKLGLLVHPSGAAPAVISPDMGPSAGQIEGRQLKNVTFHPCVNLGRYNESQMLSFVPPDGEFELAKYRVTEGIRLPFKATSLITEQGRTRVDVTVKVRSEYASNVSATRCIVLIPVPAQTARAKFQLSAGKAKYDAQRNALVWKIKKFAGMAEHTLVATVELISTTKERDQGTGRAPISLHFQLPNLCVSGTQVSQLQVWEKSAYKVDKWVRFNTRSDVYEIRTS